jgi:type IV pilus assembly protein PilA
MNRLLRRLARNEGFTLAELLIVVIVAGILLAIAVPSYIGFTRKARDTAEAANARSTSVTQAGAKALESVAPSAGSTSAAASAPTDTSTSTATSTGTSTSTSGTTSSAQGSTTTGPGDVTTQPSPGRVRVQRPTVPRTRVRLSTRPSATTRPG